MSEIPKVEIPIQTPITAGMDTSEYAMNKRAQTVLTAIAVISAAATPIVALIPATSKWSAICTGILAGLAVLGKTLISLGYTKSRTDVKTSSNTGELIPPVGK